MKKSAWFVIVSAVVALAAPDAALPRSAEPPATPAALDLSAEVRELLRAEMREVAGGVQQIAAALPIAGWDPVHGAATQIRDSYIMNRSLTDSQARELAQALPERFEQMDVELHMRAEKLAEAAHARDAELAAFHFGRMLESCSGCHAAYARDRFPAFAPSPEPAHQH